jgi:hypothetical protein
MLFPHVSAIDSVWETIRVAYEEGKLCSATKMATMRRENSNAISADQKLICVYTYDSDDMADLQRVVDAQRDVGIPHRLIYKEDAATLAGEYSFNSPKPVSKWIVMPGSREIRKVKGR